MFRIEIVENEQPVFAVKLEKAKRKVEIILLRKYKGEIDHILWTWSWVDFLYRAWLIYPDDVKVVAASIRKQINYTANNVITFPCRD